MRFFEIFVMLKSAKSIKPYTHENFISILDFYTNTLISNKIIENFSDSSYMTESNDCITIRIEVSSLLDKQIIVDFISNITTPLLLNFSLDLKNKYTYFSISDNDLLNFLYLEHKPLISLLDIPENIKTIQFNTDMCLSANDEPKLFVSFFDNNNKKLNICTPWAKQAEQILKTHFTAHSVDSLTLKFVYIILFGSNPSKEVLDAIDNKFFITTEFMDNFDFFEKNKINENIILTQNM
jgi:hypothetical protein